MGRRIAYGGILTALCVVLIYFAAYMPSGKLGIYALSSLIIAIAVVELGIRLGLLVYAAAAILILLLAGNLNALLLFTLFFGSYPLLKYYIERSRNAVSEMLLKFGSFNLLLVIGYFAFKLIFGMSPIFIEASSLVFIGIILAAQAVFLVYDYILSRLIAYYLQRIKSANYRQ